MGCCSSKREREYLIDKYNLQPSELKAIENMFKSYAGIKNYMNFNDFKKLYAESRFEHSDEDLMAVFNAFTNSSNKVQLAEFVRLSQLCRDNSAVSDSDRFAALFEVMDCDASGCICDKEFKEFLSNFVDDEEVAMQYFSQVDTDDSKMIDFEEFCTFCKAHPRMSKVMMAYVFPPE